MWGTRKIQRWQVPDQEKVASSDKDVKGKKCYKVMIGRKRSPDSSSRQPEDLSRFSRNVRTTMPCTLLPKVVRTCGVFLAFRLWNLLRAAAACNFSSLISPDGPAPAALANLIYYYTFRPSGTTNHGKNTVIRDFSTFSRACIIFLLTPSFDSFSSLIFFLLLFSFLLFSSLLFSDSSHLCFFICSYCWKSDF